MDEVRSEAAQLELLMPQVVRVLFRLEGPDPVGHLTVAQLRIMRLLSMAPRTATGLSEELGMTPSAVSQTVQRLEKFGLVTRDVDSADRRVRHLDLSVLGHRLMIERHEMRVDHAGKILAKLHPTVRAQLISSVHAVLQVDEKVFLGEEADQTFTHSQQIK